MKVRNCREECKDKRLWNEIVKQAKTHQGLERRLKKTLGGPAVTGGFVYNKAAVLVGWLRTRPSVTPTQHVISRSRRYVNDIFALLRCYIALTGSYLQGLSGVTLPDGRQIIPKRLERITN